MTDAFRCEALRKLYSRQVVLEGLNLIVDAGQCVGLLGANGAGKTTLLKCLLGLMPLEGGRASIAGELSTAMSATLRAQIGYVPQTPSQFPWLTGQAMLRYVAAFYSNFDWDYANALMQRWQVALKTPIGTLSPGQQQRLSIVRALAPRPRYLVLDEPIAALDPATRIAVIDELLSEHRLRGISILFSSHITADLERLCNRFVVMSAGKVAFDEPTQVCRRLVRLEVTGDENILRQIEEPDFRRVRIPRPGERMLVCFEDQAMSLIARMPMGLQVSRKEDNIESLLSEWMQ